MPGSAYVVPCSGRERATILVLATPGSFKICGVFTDHARGRCIKYACPTSQRMTSNINSPKRKPWTFNGESGAVTVSAAERASYTSSSSNPTRKPFLVHLTLMRAAGTNIPRAPAGGACWEERAPHGLTSSSRVPAARMHRFVIQATAEGGFCTPSGGAWARIHPGEAQVDDAGEAASGSASSTTRGWCAVSSVGRRTTGEAARRGVPITLDMGID